MSRTRTFIAVEVNAGIRNNAAALQQTLERCGTPVRWTRPENLHVTLLFLGEVDDRQLPTLCQMVQEVAATEPPFTLGVAGVGAFPHLRRPKILWVGLNRGAEELQRLVRRLEPPLVAAGLYRREERPYTPHLTLGRVRPDADPSPLARELHKRAAWEGGQTIVHEVLIFASLLQRQGPEYAVIGRAPLAGPPPESLA